MALLQLSEALRSKTGKEKITTFESNLIHNCMVKTARSVLVCAVVSSAVVAKATMRLGRWNSACFSAGSALLVGELVFNRSTNACLEQILSIEGSRMQRELANIILKNYWKTPSRMKLVQKHFYPEVVFTDLKPERSLVRWRARNAYVDEVGSERSEEHGGGDENLETQSFAESTSDLDGVNPYQRSQCENLLANPFDYVFGYEAPSEDIRPAGSVDTTRRRRNVHKRGRKHHAENKAMMT